MPKIKEHVSFYEQIARNKRNSIFLMIIVIIVLILLSYVIGLIFQDVFFVLIIGIIITISYVLISYYKSDKIALASVQAKEADYNKYRQLYNSVEGLCLASGMPKPKIYIMPGQQINAFATGRNPKTSVICVTEGSIKKLNKQELEGVLGHELSHIANYDIRFMTLVAVMVGLIAIISQIFLRSLWFSGRSGGNRDRGKANVIILLIGIVLAILAPIAVQLVQLAISRKREYAADASSVKFIRSPTGLIQALKKIKSDSEKLKVSGAVAPLFISNPFKKTLLGLTSTHPPLDSRIQILERM
jgi:heat shock protein HtpX